MENHTRQKARLGGAGIQGRVMKAILKFDLPEDKEEFEVACHAKDFALACFEFDNRLRSYMKYGHNFTSIGNCIEEIRKSLHEIFDDYGVSTEMLS